MDTSSHRMDRVPGVWVGILVVVGVYGKWGFMSGKGVTLRCDVGQHNQEEQQNHGWQLGFRV